MTTLMTPQGEVTDASMPADRGNTEPSVPRPAVQRPAAVCRPQRPHALASGDRMHTAAGSTSESRMADLLARLADLDAIGASRIRAWDRIQARRSA